MLANHPFWIRGDTCGHSGFNSPRQSGARSANLRHACQSLWSAGDMTSHASPGNNQGAKSVSIVSFRGGLGAARQELLPAKCFCMHEMQETRRRCMIQGRPPMSRATGSPDSCQETKVTRKGRAVGDRISFRVPASVERAVAPRQGQAPSIVLRSGCDFRWLDRLACAAAWLRRRSIRSRRGRLRMSTLIADELRTWPGWLIAVVFAGLFLDKPAKAY